MGAPINIAIAVIISCPIKACFKPPPPKSGGADSSKKIVVERYEKPFTTTSININTNQNNPKIAAKKREIERCNL